MTVNVARARGHSTYLLSYGMLCAAMGADRLWHLGGGQLLTAVPPDYSCIIAADTYLNHVVGSAPRPRPVCVSVGSWVDVSTRPVLLPDVRVPNLTRA